MTAQKPTEPARHETLAAALAAFQAALPTVHKTATGQVPGKRNHKYADLADLSAAVLPLLGAQGLSWITMPTVEDGRFVLRYELLHESGQSRIGYYPLPTDSDAWKIGSALTYGRRYLLSAVTGVAADEDDDGAAAQGAAHDGGRRQAGRDEPPRDEPVEPSPVDTARVRLFELVEQAGWDVVEVRKKFAAQYKYPLREAADPNVVTAFGKLLPSLMEQAAPAETEPAAESNGAAQ